MKEIIDILGEAIDKLRALQKNSECVRVKDMTQYLLIWLGLEICRIDKNLK